MVGSDWGRGAWGGFVCQDERWSKLPARARVHVGSGSRALAGSDSASLRTHQRLARGGAAEEGVRRLARAERR